MLVFANWDFKFLPLMQHLVVFLRQLLQFHCLLLILQILHPLPLLQEVCLGEQRLVIKAVQQQVRQETQLLQRLRDFLGFQEQAKHNSFRVKLHTEKLLYMIIFQQVMTKSYKYYLFLPPCRLLSLSWLL